MAARTFLGMLRLAIPLLPADMRALAPWLLVLLLDLGRPERMVVAATHYNFTSVFAWNVFLYTGMFSIVAVYLWVLMEKRMGGYTGAVGLAAFVSALTTLAPPGPVEVVAFNTAGARCVRLDPRALTPTAILTPAWPAA